MDPDSWKPVENEGGNVLIGEGDHIVLQNITTKEIGYAKNTVENRRLLGIPVTNEVTKKTESMGSALLKADEQNQPYLDLANEFDQEQHIEELCKYVEMKTTNNKVIIWTHGLTKLLIRKRLAREKEFNRPKCKKIKLWNDIGTEITKKIKGVYSLRGEQCDNKFGNLLKTYKANKKKQNSTGKGAIFWEYFGDFDEILGCKASIQPPTDTLFDTMDHQGTQKEKENAEQFGEISVLESDSDGHEQAVLGSRQPHLVVEKKKTLKFNEYLHLKNKRDEEKEKRKEMFEQQKWEEEKELRKEETNAILKLAEALVKKNQ